MQSSVAKKRRIQAFLEEHAISQKPMEERKRELGVRETKRVRNFRCEGSSRNAAAAQRAGSAQREKRENGERGDQVTGRTGFTGSVAIISEFFFKHETGVKPDGQVRWKKSLLLSVPD
jgi:hypothetical protein